MAADAAEHRASRPLHVDLAVEVDLDGGVHRDERPGGQAPEVVGVLDGVQDRAAVRPRVEPRAASQVGGHRVADQQPAARQVGDGIGQQARVDRDGHREPAQQRVADRARADLEPHALGDEPGDAAGDLLMLACRRRVP
jgi:hypothetical protein